MEQDKKQEGSTITYKVAGVAVTLGLGTAVYLAHLPKDDPTLPLTLAPGLKFAATTSSSGAMSVSVRQPR